MSASPPRLVKEVERRETSCCTNLHVAKFKSIRLMPFYSHSLSFTFLYLHQFHLPIPFPTIPSTSLIQSPLLHLNPFPSPSSLPPSLPLFLPPSTHSPILQHTPGLQCSSLVITTSQHHDQTSQQLLAVLVHKRTEPVQPQDDGVKEEGQEGRPVHLL